MNIQAQTPKFDDPIHSVELEQQILGAVLTDNSRFDLISGTICSEDFYEPVHERIWRNIAGRVRHSHPATPVTLKVDFETDDGLAQLGGAKYLVRLAGASVSGSLVADYAEQLAAVTRQRVLQLAMIDGLHRLNARQPMGDIKAGLDLTLTELGDESGLESSVSWRDAMAKTIERMNDAYQSDRPLGLQTGLRDLDERTGGLFAQDLIILAGRPSMGKTSLATSIALRVAKQNVPVAIVSLEMSDEGLCQRMLSELSGVPYRQYRRAHQMSEAEFRKTVERAEQNSDLPIEIVPPHITEIASIFSTLRRIDNKYKRCGGKGLGLVLVDYLQLGSAKGNSTQERIANLSMNFKRIAKMLDLPVLCLSQLSRAVESRENKRPMLSDLRDSGQIEQDADVVLFCYRDAYYLERELPRTEGEEREAAEAALRASQNVMEVITAKQRMGAIGTDLIGCSVATNRFWDLTQQEEFPV